MNKEIIPEVVLSVFTNHTPPEAVVSGFVPGNESNVWYFKDSLGQERIIKRYPSWVKESDIKWIHGYMYRLVEHNYPLARPINDPVSDSNSFFAIYEYATGEIYNTNNPLHISDMAVKLRLLHDMGRDINIPGSRHWPTTFGYVANQEALEKIDFEQQKRLLVDSWKLSRLLLSLSDLSVIPIHGDFRGDNIRFDQGGVAKVFDFGNARNDYAEVDMAITLRDISKGLRQIDLVERQASFIREYNSSGMDASKISPEGLCHAELTLAIQECLYLWQEWKKTGELKLLEKFKLEYDYLDQTRQLIPIQLSRLRE